jgi:dihydrofolate reductase
LNRKLILYIAASFDGYIAAPGDDLNFLSLAQLEGEDYGYGGFMENVDTVIMGRKTFQWVAQQTNGLPHPDLDTYIITHKERPPIGKTKFYNGNLRELVTNLKQTPGKNIFCDGGAEIVNELLNEKLIDEMIISFIPILLGDGVRLFKDERPEQLLMLISHKSFDSGLLQVRYVIKND